MLDEKFLSYISCYACPVDSQESGSALRAPDPRDTRGPRGRLRRVLVVDDSPLMLLAARLGLDRPDRWDVSTAASGQAALALAAESRPDAILLDVTMPDLDGPATLRALREQVSTQDIPVVFLTAASADRALLLSLGAAGVIAKPFDPAALGDQLGEVLGWPT
jgi:CheY-like chemotaxis protein